MESYALDTKLLTICMVTNNYTPYSGGVVSSIQALAHALRAHGHRVIIVTLDFTQASSQEADVERLECIGHFLYKKNPIALPLNAKAQLEKLVSHYKPDVVHVHHPFILGPAAVCIARAHQLPVIFTHHSLYEHYAHYIPLPEWLVRPLARKVVRDFCMTVDHVIVPSDSIKHHLLTQNVGCSLSVISSGVLPLFVTDDQIKKAIPSDRPIELLTVSRFVPEKNIEWLLDMFSLLLSRNRATFILKLVGYGAWLERLKQYAYKRLQLPTSAVTFLERPDKAELVQAYRHADIFVFASQSETQGLVVAEAFCQSTPVIALHGPGIIDSVQSGFNGFVVNSVHEMAEKIEQVIANPTLFASLQQGAFQSARFYYPSYAAQQIYGVYRSQLDKPRR